MKRKCCLCKKYKKQLRKVFASTVKWAQKQNINLIKNDNICGTCYSRILKSEPIHVDNISTTSQSQYTLDISSQPSTSGFSTVSSENTSSEAASEDTNFILPDITCLNSMLKSINCSPVKPKQMKRESYRKKSYLKFLLKLHKMCLICLCHL